MSVRPEISSLNLIVLGDAELLQLALSNLLENAIDFSPSGAEIGLKVTALNDDIHIDVIDSGPGFADYMRDRIGERFLSTPRPGHTKDSRAISSRGSGLGLAIAKQVAELHGGTLTVVSFAQPTVVRITLPLRR